MGRAKNIILKLTEASFTPDEMELLQEWKDYHDRKTMGGLDHKMNMHDPKKNVAKQKAEASKKYKNLFDQGIIQFHHDFSAVKSCILALTNKGKEYVRNL